MKILKYIGATVFLIIGLAETVPIYLISSGLLLGQGGESKAYFLGKLAAHVLFFLIAAAIATKLFRSASTAENDAS